MYTWKDKPEAPVLTNRQIEKIIGDNFEKEFISDPPPKPSKELPRFIELKSGYKMPVVGYGCWKVPNQDMAESAYQAIKVGYRLLDEAAIYGNEKECGQGIKRAITEGIVKREDLFVTSKLWNTFHAKEHVKMACKKSLEDLGLDYLDLYLIHWPMALKFVPIETRYPAGYYFDPDAAKKEVISVPIPYKETW